MSKLEVVGGVRRGRRQRAVALPPAVEGELAELCRDLTIEAKRIRRLQEQADELLAMIRRWVGHSDPSG